MLTLADAMRHAPLVADAARRLLFSAYAAMSLRLIRQMPDIYALPRAALMPRRFAMLTRAMRYTLAAAERALCFAAMRHACFSDDANMPVICASAQRRRRAPR